MIWHQWIYHIAWQLHMSVGEDMKNFQSFWRIQFRSYQTIHSHHFMKRPVPSIVLVWIHRSHHVTMRFWSELLWECGRLSVVLRTIRSTELGSLGVIPQSILFPSVASVFSRWIARQLCRLWDIPELRYCEHLSDTRPHKSDSHLVKGTDFPGRLRSYKN